MRTISRVCILLLTFGVLGLCVSEVMCEGYVASSFSSSFSTADTDLDV